MVLPQTVKNKRDFTVMVAVTVASCVIREADESEFGPAENKLLVG
jgi:hypothetical protein